MPGSLHRALQGCIPTSIKGSKNLTKPLRAQKTGSWRPGVVVCRILKQRLTWKWKKMVPWSTGYSEGAKATAGHTGCAPAS